MPHYKDGAPAKVGDRVKVTFEVTGVYEGEDACNVGLRVVNDVEGEYPPTLTTNSRYCELAEREWTPPDNPFIEG